MTQVSSGGHEVPEALRQHRRGDLQLRGPTRRHLAHHLPEMRDHLEPGEQLIISIYQSIRAGRLILVLTDLGQIKKAIQPTFVN